jgi:hypothetical protein
MGEGRELPETESCQTHLSHCEKAKQSRIATSAVNCMKNDVQRVLNPTSSPE